jgi:hypothetical protein
MPACERDELFLRWDNDDAHAQLRVELGQRCATIDIRTAGKARRYIINENLLNVAADHGAIEMERNA